MRKAGIDAITFDAEFAQDTRDDVWLPTAAERGWVVITKDMEIRRNFSEIDAIMVNKVGVFLLPNGMKAVDMIALVLNPKVRKRMEGIARSRSGPFIYSFYRDGRDERRDTDKWLKAWRDERAKRGLPPIP